MAKPDKNKANVFEVVLVVSLLLSTMGFVFYFYNLRHPSLTEDDPFRDFEHNPGIIRISIAALVTRIIFMVCFGLLAVRRFMGKKIILTVYLLMALSIGSLQWFELYYGSSFIMEKSETSRD